ncbi:MAG: hypothetical protein K2I16_07460 [Muribaculaceae bacterium]|nr:hypothetical protein [Muribaculaceae bacterium]
MTDSHIYKFVSDGFDKAKSGDAVAVYNIVSQYHDNGSLPEKSHYAFGWIIYYALLQTGDGEIESRKKMLARYFKLKLTVPHKLHSMILTQAIRLYKDAKNLSYPNSNEIKTKFSIIKFADLWDIENLRPGDWNRKKLDDKQLSSTVEKLITVCVDEFENTNTAPSQKYMNFFDKAVSEYSDSVNVLNQRATVHIICNETEQAASLLRNAILMAPGKFFLWSRLASLISPNENPHLCVSILYKALSAPGKEQFKGKIRISLAEILIDRGAFPQALWELQKIKSIYESNGWHLPAKIDYLQKKIPAQTIPENPERIYKKVEHLAYEDVYNSLPALYVVKTYHKQPSQTDMSAGYSNTTIAWRVTDNEGKNYWLQPHRYKMDTSLPLGTPLFIQIHNGKVVNAKLA